MNIKYSKQAIKYLSKMSTQKRGLLISKINQLPLGDVKPMRDDEYAYRLRVGSIRVLFDMFVDYMFIGKIKPRGDIYK